MKCLLGMFIGMGVCLMPLTADAGKPDPKPKDAKVLIAHLQEEVVTESEEIDDELGSVLVVTTTKYYVVLEISPKAVPAHERHGDLMEVGDHVKGDKFTVETTETTPIME